jgi:hypothetical protein
MNEFQKWDRRREPSDRLLGRAAADKPSRCRLTIVRSPNAQVGQSCHGLLWSSLGCVGCFFPARVFCTGSSSSWCERRHSPQPCLSLAAIRSWVCGRLLQGSALGLLHSYDRARGDIPAVAGPSAYSGDLRLVDPSDLEAVTADHGDVLPFRIDIPSEVFAPSGGAL